MSHIETANTKLSLPVFIEIAETLEVQTDVLLYDSPRENVSNISSEIVAILENCNLKQARIITFPAAAENTQTSGLYTYEIKGNGTISITEFDCENNEADVFIPSSRPFDLFELKLMIDSIQSSKLLSEGKWRSPRSWKAFAAPISGKPCSAKSLFLIV